MAEVNDICARNSMVKSKFIKRGIQMALDDARKRFGEASNDPVAAPAPVTPAIAPRQVHVASDEMPTLKRGDTVWFPLDAVCAALDVTRDSLLSEIDPADDILDYQGKRWIDATGIAEARSLCRDPASSDRFWTWAQEKINV